MSNWDTTTPTPHRSLSSSDFSRLRQEYNRRYLIGRAMHQSHRGCSLHCTSSSAQLPSRCRFLLRICSLDGTRLMQTPLPVAMSCCTGSLSRVNRWTTSSCHPNCHDSTTSCSAGEQRISAVRLGSHHKQQPLHRAHRRRMMLSASEQQQQPGNATHPGQIHPGTTDEEHINASSSSSNMQPTQPIHAATAHALMTVDKVSSSSNSNGSSGSPYAPSNSSSSSISSITTAGGITSLIADVLRQQQQQGGGARQQVRSTRGQALSADYTY